jgi:hypothetical protein
MINDIHVAFFSFLFFSLGKMKCTLTFPYGFIISKLNKFPTYWRRLRYVSIKQMPIIVRTSAVHRVYLQYVISTKFPFLLIFWGPSCSWSYGSWIYNYLSNQCLSPLKLWVWTLLMWRHTWYNIMW